VRLAAIRSRLTFANVVSLMAMFVALSGGAYALTIPRNSVGAKQLKKNAVTRAKIKKGAVTSSNVADRSLLAKDFKAGQLPKVDEDSGIHARVSRPSFRGPPAASRGIGSRRDLAPRHDPALPVSVG
jgi:hypothetical protein